MKPIRIFSSQLEFLTEIDNYESLIFTRRWHKPGEFIMHINRHKQGTEHLQKGNIVMLSPTKAGIIRHREIVLGPEGKGSEQITIIGHTLQGIAGQRIIVPPEGQSHDIKSGPAETVIKHYASNCMINPTNPARKIPLAVLATDQGRGPNISWQSRFKNLAEELEKISLLTGLGWNVYIDLQTMQWVFEVYEGRNLTAGQGENPPVIFSPDFDNIKTQKYIESDIDRKSLAYVGGQGEGVDRTIVTVPELPWDEPVEYVHSDSTKADFEAGTLDGVVVDNGVELVLQNGFLTGNPLSGYEDIGISGEYELLQGTLHLGETGVTGFASGKLTNGSWGTMVADTNISNANADYVIWLFDLKANYSIHGIFFEWILHPDFPAAYGGQEVIAEYSEDGVSYTTLPAKDLSGITTGGNYLESWTGISAVARYVRIKVKNKPNRYMIINDIGIFGSAYSPQGTLIKEIDISTEAEVETTKIEWTSTTPTDTSVTIETALSLDGGENYGEWQTATNGGPIPGITGETDLSNARLKYRATLETTDTSTTPKLHLIINTIDGVIHHEGDVVIEGLELYETFVDARDISNPTDLPDRGRQHIADETRHLEGDILTHGSFKYEKDWDLGDIVTIQNKDWGVTMDVRVTEVTEVYEPSGYRLSAILGDSMPKLTDKIKKELEQISAEVRR